MSHRKIILNLCTSLDGYIEGPHGEIDWCLTDQDYGMTPFLERVDTILFGRKSYEQMLAMGPDPFPNHQKVIFSTTVVALDGAQVLPDVSHMRDVLQESGKDLWLFGGAGLVHDFLEEDLVDEMMIAVHPLLLGEGKPLFKTLSGRKSFELVEAKPYSSGLVQLIYRLKK